MIPGSLLDETGSLHSGVELTNSKCSILSEERIQGEAAIKESIGVKSGNYKQKLELSLEVQKIHYSKDTYFDMNYAVFRFKTNNALKEAK